MTFFFAMNNLSMISKKKIFIHVKMRLVKLTKQNIYRKYRIL